MNDSPVEKAYLEEFRRTLDEAQDLASRGHLNRAMSILEDVLNRKPLLMRTVRPDVKPKARDTDRPRVDS